MSPAHQKRLALKDQPKGAPVPTAMPTLADYLTRWLDETVKPDLAPATYVYYETMVRLYISPFLGSKRLDRLQSGDVQAWLDRLPTMCQCCLQGKDAARPENRRRCCALGECCREQANPRTIQAARNTLRAALTHAISSNELPTRNAAAQVPAPEPPSRRRNRPSWTAAQANTFLSSAREDDDPLYAAYVLILITNLHRGQVLGLTWPSIDLDRCELDASAQLQRVGRQLLHSSHARKPVLLPPICCAALTLRAAQQDAARAQAGGRWQPGDFVFTTRRGTPIDPRNFNRSFDARCAKAGVPRIRLRDAHRFCPALPAELEVQP